MKYALAVLSILLFAGILVYAAYRGYEVYTDYGVSWDEPPQRIIGRISREYVYGENDKLLDFNNRIYGVALELPLSMAEGRFYHRAPLKDIYEFRHLVVHVIFLVALLVAGLVGRIHFGNFWYGILAVLLLAFTPRLYGHSFFNSKDIPFLCGYIFCVCTWLLAFRSYRVGLFALHGVMVGITCNLRIMGVMMFALTFAAIVFDLIFNRQHERAHYRRALLVFLLSSFLALYVSWPYLWTNPLRLGSIFAEMSHFRWGGSVLFNGVVVKAKGITPYYGLTWFVITTPVVYLAFLAIGVFAAIKNGARQPQSIFTNSPVRDELMFFACFAGPLVAVVVLKSTLYDGWRQLYFIYSGALPLMLVGVRKALQCTRKWKWIACAPLVILLAQFGSVAYFYYRHHPHEHTYFNRLISHAENSIRDNWEQDYWGLSFRKGVEFLATQYPDGEYSVRCNIKSAILNRDVFLTQEDAERFKMKSGRLTDSDFVLTNYRLENAATMAQLEKSNDLVYSIVVNNSTIVGVYKKKS